MLIFWNQDWIDTIHKYLGLKLLLCLFWKLSSYLPIRNLRVNDNKKKNWIIVLPSYNFTNNWMTISEIYRIIESAIDSCRSLFQKLATFLKEKLLDLNQNKQWNRPFHISPLYCLNHCITIATIC